MEPRAALRSPGFSPSEEERRSAESVDVVVVGGGFSGSSAATLLLRKRPDLRVVVVERTREFDRKVGEATVELSSLFLVRGLGLSTYLARSHLPKHGLRYWYHASPDDDPQHASEIGTRDCAHVPSYLLARDRLDSHVSALAQQEGAQLLRPARVRGVELGPFENYVEVLEGDRRRLLRCPWLIDASGRGTVLARRFGWLDTSPEHPIGAIWGRWTGVFDLDGPHDDRPGLGDARTCAPRTLCTNHLCARGSWIWFIPLSSGETSVGIVYHHDMHRLDKDPDRRKAYLRFLDMNPISRRWLRDASLVEDDLRCLPLLPHVTTRYMGHGHALVGDAAGFIDPFYSPGLDHCSQSTLATVRIVLRYFESGVTEALSGAIAKHDRVFRTSYRRYRDAIFVPKYRFLGDWDLFSAAYFLDVAGYFFTLARPSWRSFEKNYCRPPLTGGRWMDVGYRLARYYNRRLARIADRRARMGRTGVRNLGRRRTSSFGFEWWTIARHIVTGVGLYAAAELDHLLSFLRPRPRQRGSEVLAELEE